MKRLALFATFGWGVLLNAAGPAAQSASPPAFDVASVKSSTASFSSGVKTGPGRLAATGISLNELIQRAYGVSDLQISGLPAKLGLFDIEGKADGSHTRSELLQMLQTLLADRFKLTLHREMKELPVEALVAGKNGPKLQSAATEGDPGISVHAGRSAGAVVCTGQNVALPFVANYLSGRLRRIVVDKTGLAGNFDFNAELSVDRNEFTDPNIPEQENISHLMTDLVSKLGLKLESQRAPVEILVVDHAGKPDEN